MKIKWIIALSILAGHLNSLNISRCHRSEEVDGIPTSAFFEPNSTQLIKNISLEECVDRCCDLDNCTIAGLHNNFCVLTQCDVTKNCSNHSTTLSSDETAKFVFLTKIPDAGHQDGIDNDVEKPSNNSTSNNTVSIESESDESDSDESDSEDNKTDANITDNTTTALPVDDDDDNRNSTDTVTELPRHATTQRSGSKTSATKCNLKCAGKASCSLGSDGKPSCVCKDSAKVYVDDKCVIKPVCSEESCPENSTCTVKDNKLTCQCTDGFQFSEEHGVCEELTCANITCPKHSTCTIKGKKIHCFCNKKYKAIQGFCREDKPCTVDPENKGCPDDEQCKSVNTKNLECFCVPGKKRNNETGDCTDDAPKIELTTKNVTITLPEDNTTLTVEVTPARANDSDYYTYTWSVKSAPKDSSADAKMSGMSNNEVKITDLVEGEYVFGVDVIGKLNEFKSKVVSVTVLPKPHANNPPVAVIKPAGDLSLKLPANVALNAIDSSDDDKIVSYKWTIEEQPALAKLQFTGETTDTLHVKITEGKGDFVFKVVVKDSQELEGVATKTVKILAEDDFPPSAKVSPPQVLTLPDNKVTLYGNESKDDHEIVRYQWEKTDDSPKTGDMQGTTADILKLANLEEGTYTFILTVWDKKDQNSSASTTVTVRTAKSGPPKANAGENKELIEPDSSTRLDGSGSVSPLGSLTHYHWEQVAGPSNSVIKGENSSEALVSGLVRGSYKFKLTVTDKKNVTASDEVVVSVKKDNNKPPKAILGHDLTIYLPNTAVDIDGSNSTDDDRIVRWKWTRSDQSPAIGNVVNQSDTQPILKLCDLTIGLYTFTLTVYDKKDLKDSASVAIKVEDDPHAADIIEVYLFDDPATFTHQRLQSLKKVLMVPISSSPAEDDTIDLKVLSVKVINQKVVVYFYGVNTTTGRVLPGTPIVQTLREMVFGKMLNFNFDVIDTATCSNTCNDHGMCETKTRTCVCDKFWMENFFKASAGRQFSNCEWSKIYFGIVLSLILVIFISVLYIVYYVISLRNRELLKRKRYKLLEEETGRGVTLQDSSDEEYAKLKKRKTIPVIGNRNNHHSFSNFKSN